MKETTVVGAAVCKSCLMLVCVICSPDLQWYMSGLQARCGRAPLSFISAEEMKVLLWVEWKGNFFLNSWKPFKCINPAKWELLPILALQAHRSWLFWVSVFLCTDLKNFLLQENTGCGSGRSLLSCNWACLLHLKDRGSRRPRDRRVKKKMHGWSGLIPSS